MEGGHVPTFRFFWGHSSKKPHVDKECLSQWFPASFVVDGIAFPTAEHFMMHGKALLFGDAHAASMILSAKSPAEAKELGRHVRDFDEAVWERERFGIVCAASLAKFRQNAELRHYLLRTKTDILVEASPHDRIWGIGLRETDAAARDVNRWRGMNLLGFALMHARSSLRQT